MIETLKNVRRAVALSVALGMGATACGSKGMNLSQTEAIAHKAGFTDVTPRDGHHNQRLWVQFGACLLPVEVKKDHLKLDAVTYNGQAAGSGVSINSISPNVAAHALGNDVRLQQEFDHLTHSHLEQLTRAGITGLEPCLKTTDQISAIIDQLK